MCYVYWKTAEGRTKCNWGPYAALRAVVENHCSTVTPLVERSLHKSNLIKLFAQFRHIVNIHSLTLTSNFSNLWKHCYRFTHVFSHCIKLRALPLAAVTISLHYLPRCLCSKVTCSKTSPLLPLFEVNLWRFVAMWLLHNKEQPNTIRLLVSQAASAGKRADMSEQ